MKYAVPLILIYAITIAFTIQYIDGYDDGYEKAISVPRQKYKPKSPKVIIFPICPEELGHPEKPDSVRWRI